MVRVFMQHYYSIVVIKYRTWANCELFGLSVNSDNINMA